MTATQAALKVATAKAILADDTKFGDLLFDVTNAFALTVQNAIGQTDGGIAGCHFMEGDEPANRLARVLRDYLKAEELHETDEEEAQ